MNKNVAVFTGTRAEYGLLYWLLKDIESDSVLNLQLLVSGTHLSHEFGETYRQIESDGFLIDEKVEILLSSNNSVGVAKSIGLGVLGFADALSRLAPNLLVILGDRFEALAVAQTAAILRIPIVHLHGGEITEGAYDDVFRHAITKFSYLHLTSTETYRRRVIQLGEDPSRVHNVGALGLDHLKRTSFLNLDALGKSLNFRLDKPYFLVTYHPVTLGNEPVEQTCLALLAALDRFQDYKVIITHPNADDGGRSIIRLVEHYAHARPDRVLSVVSLGQIRYLSVVKHSALVVGNSSSGIIEAPSFNVPTVNIGCRQQGRLASQSVINVGPDEDSIVNGIFEGLKVVSEERREKFLNPYGEGDASSKIIDILKTSDGDPPKRFYDLPEGSSTVSNL